MMCGLLTQSGHVAAEQHWIWALESDSITIIYAQLQDESNDICEPASGSYQYQIPETVALRICTGCQATAIGLELW
jgi:hypothetical protein